MDESRQGARFSPDDLSDWFWRVIKEARSDRSLLHLILEKTSRDDIIRFYDEFQEAAVQLTDSRYADHMTANSEDSIQDVAEWVVSQGKEFFSKIWAHPEQLREFQQIDPQTTFSSVAENVFWQRFQESMPTSEG